MKLSVAARILLTWVGTTCAVYHCPSVTVLTGGTPCTFCPAPTCTNLAVSTLSCQCARPVHTVTSAAPACQTAGACNTISCATSTSTWTVLCPTTIVSSPVMPPGACYTIHSTTTGAAACAPLTCSTPFCVSSIHPTMDCGCRSAVTSLTTVPCPTTCGDIPCPTTTIDYSLTGCSTISGLLP